MLFIVTGMVKRCHCTIELVIKKCMTDRTDWNVMLNLVLFSVRCQTHSSIGYSPFHMLYQTDPIFPFQYADQTENSELNSDLDTVADVNINSDVDPVMEMVEHLEAQCKSVL